MVAYWDMSKTTSVLLLLSAIEEAPLYEGASPEALAVSKLERWLAEAGHVDIRLISEHVPGGKLFQGSVYAGSYNYFDIEGFLREVERQPWCDPNAVQVLVKHEHQEVFRLYMFKSGALNPILPLSGLGG
jgi:hypothetical protein